MKCLWHWFHNWEYLRPIEGRDGGGYYGCTKCPAQVCFDEDGRKSDWTTRV